MRTFLFISEVGASIGIARKVQESGNKVYFYVNNKQYTKIGDGFVDKVCEDDVLFQGDIFSRIVFDQLKLLNPDIVMFDYNFDAANTLKIEFEKVGVPSYGASLLSKSIKNNLPYLSKILNMSGIMTGDAPDSAMPITYSITYNASKVSSSSIYFEYTRLMNDDMGPVAYMGSIGYHGNTSALDNQVREFLDLLTQSNYSGKMDLFLRVHQQNLWCDGISFYFNPNTIYAFLENINSYPADFFYDCAMNQQAEFGFKSPWSCQITCGVPPFPYTVETQNPKEVSGIDSGVMKHLWITDLDKSGSMYVSKPITGNVFSVSSRGGYIREAKRRAYRTLSNISLDELMFRTDIGQDTADRCRQLRQWNWLNISDDELVEPFKTHSQQVPVAVS